MVNTRMLKQHHYCVYTRDFNQCKDLFRDFGKHVVPFECHVNRTRFWLCWANPLHIWFYLKYSNRIHSIEHETNHSLGR